jgi:hypothetical protein
LTSEPAAGVEVDGRVGAGDFGLQQNEPNPFRESTAIRYSLAGGGAVRLEIFDVRGREVRTLVDADLSEGPHTTVWRGKDGQGRQLPAGIYFCRLTAGRRTATRKMIYLK